MSRVWQLCSSFALKQPWRGHAEPGEAHLLLISMSNSFQTAFFSSYFFLVKPISDEPQTVLLTCSLYTSDGMWLVLGLETRLLVQYSRSCKTWFECLKYSKICMPLQFIFLFHHAHCQCPSVPHPSRNTSRNSEPPVPGQLCHCIAAFWRINPSWYPT